MSQLLNLMARVKAWFDDQDSEPIPPPLLDTAVQNLVEYIDTLDDENTEEYCKFNFILGQLKLLSKSKYARHYSPQLIILGYIIHATSAAAYKVLLAEKVLCLPSISTLTKVTRQVDSNSGLDNTSYLKLRVSKLNSFERNVLLIIDEIYIAKRVEYSAGEVHGLTSEGEVASTLLCFMIKSLVSKYKDLVAIYPMANLNAAKQNKCYNDAKSTIRKVGLNVVAVSVDNASTNRKFFIDFLCDGVLRTSIIDAETNEPLFLMFDSTHDLKNVYNNFQKRKHFECPEFRPQLPDGCKANFNHIVDLYNHEASSSLKKAHKLSPAVLNPKSIEKTSMKLSTAVFCESTRDALNYYAVHCDKPQWNDTADFISLILKLWNIVNVKSSTKGVHCHRIRCKTQIQNLNELN